jgi:hypothetical protein
MEDETLASTPSKEWPLDSLLKEGNKIIRNLSSSSPSRYASWCARCHLSLQRSRHKEGQ